MSDQSTITIDKLTKYIQSKHELYDATIRNGYYLPKEGSSIITEDYLMSVINGTIFCPQFRDIKLLPCPTPPTKSVLINKLEKTMIKLSKNIGITEKNLPDKHWALVVLSTYHPKDEIFLKGYLPPARPKLLQPRTV